MAAPNQHMSQTSDIPLSSTTLLPIADLNPLLPSLSSRSIRAVVTLIWPYSDSKKSISLLLAEPDFRLRRARGQVRIYFHGSAAKAVARSGVSSGDVVVLGLEGSEWIKGETVMSTPGRGIGWDLRFIERLRMMVNPEFRQSVALDIDHPTPSPEPEAQDGSPTPSPPPQVQIQPVPRPLEKDPASEWSSPAFLKRSRLSSGSFLDSAYDPFADADGYTGNQGRKRTKFGRESREWRYVERSPSPAGETSSTPPFETTNGMAGSSEEVLENTNGVASIEIVAESQAFEESHVQAHESTETADRPETTEAGIRTVEVEMEDVSHATIPTTNGHEMDAQVQDEDYSLDQVQVTTDTVDMGLDSMGSTDQILRTNDAALPLTSGSKDVFVVPSRPPLVLQTDSGTTGGNITSSSSAGEPQGTPMSPILRPIPSPSLPLPSPFASVMQERIDYFNSLETHKQPRSDGLEPRIRLSAWAGENSYSFVEHESSELRYQAQQEIHGEGEKMDTIGQEDRPTRRSPRPYHESDLPAIVQPMEQENEQEEDGDEDRWESGEDDDKENLHPSIYRQSMSSLDPGELVRGIGTHFAEESDVGEEEELHSSPPLEHFADSGEMNLDEQESDDHEDEEEDGREDGEMGFEELVSEAESEAESAFGSESDELGHSQDLYTLDQTGRPREDMVGESESEIDESDQGQEASYSDGEDGSSEDYDSGEENVELSRRRQPEVIDLISDDEEDEEDYAGSYNNYAPGSFDKGQPDDRRPSFGLDGMDEYSVKSESDTDDHSEGWNLIRPSRKYLKTSQATTTEIATSDQQTLVVEEEIRVTREHAEEHHGEITFAIQDQAGPGHTYEVKQTGEDEEMEGTYEKKAVETQHDHNNVDTPYQAGDHMEIDDIDRLEQRESATETINVGNTQFTAESEGDTFVTVPEPSDKPGAGEKRDIIVEHAEDIVEAIVSTESEQRTSPVPLSNGQLREGLALENGYPKLPGTSSTLTGTEFNDNQLSFATAVTQRQPDDQEEKRATSPVGEVTYPTLPTIRESGEQTPLPLFEPYQRAPKPLTVGDGSHQLMTPEATQQTYASLEHETFAFPDSAQGEPASQISLLPSQGADSQAEALSQETHASPTLSASPVAERQPSPTLSPRRGVEPNSISLQALEQPTNHIEPSPLTPALTARTSSGLQDVVTPATASQTSLISKLREIKSASSKKAAEIISPWFTSSLPAPASQDTTNLDSEKPREPLVEATSFAPEKQPAPYVSENKLSPSPDLVGLTTTLSFFSHLSSLPTLFNSQIDVLATIPSPPSNITRATRKPRHYHVTLPITDPTLPSTGPVSTVSVRIHRPFKKALPLVQEGDVVLLRGFKVVSVKGRMGLKSGDASAWAVWSSNTTDPDIRGPPVEFGEGELKEVGRLGEWWKEVIVKKEEEKKKSEEGEEEIRGEFTMVVGEEMEEGERELDAHAVEMDIMMSEQNDAETPVAMG